MERAQWFDPLLTLLATQPAETTRVTIAFAEIAALTDVPIPDAAYAHSYWLQRERGPLRRRLHAAGWRIVGMQEGVNATLTLARLPPDTTP